MASKEMAEKKQSKNNVKDRKRQMNGVMITVYVESPTTSSRKISDPIKKTRPHPQFRRLRAAGAQGYDRRAQLLAYSRQLRNAGSEEVQLPRKQSGPKIQNCFWFQFCTPSSRMVRRSSSRWRYDPVAFKENKELNRSRKRKSSGKNSSPFLRKLKSMLKELSCKEIKC